MADQDEQLTLPQIAQMLSLNPSTIRLWVNEKRLPAQRVGRKWFVRRGDLEAMLEQRPKRSDIRPAERSDLRPARGVSSRMLVRHVRRPLDRGRMCCASNLPLRAPEDVRGRRRRRPAAAIVGPGRARRFSLLVGLRVWLPRARAKVGHDVGDAPDRAWLGFGELTQSLEVLDAEFVVVVFPTPPLGETTAIVTQRRRRGPIV